MKKEEPVILEETDRIIKVKYKGVVSIKSKHPGLTIEEIKKSIDEALTLMEELNNISPDRKKELDEYYQQTRGRYKMEDDILFGD